MRLTKWRTRNIAFLCLTSALSGCPQPAHAHGDAEWIMRDPRYLDNQGIHCCGPSDCGPVPANEVTEDNETISHGGQTLRKRDRGIYWSIDNRYWVCRRYDGLKCIFRPQPGS